MLNWYNCNIRIILFLISFIFIIKHIILIFINKTYFLINSYKKLLNFNCLYFIEYHIDTNLISCRVLISFSLKHIVLPVWASCEHCSCTYFRWIILISINCIISTVLEFIRLIAALKIINEKYLQMFWKICLVFNLLRLFIMLNIYKYIFQIQKTELVVLFVIGNLLMVNKWNPIRTWT